MAIWTSTAWFYILTGLLSLVTGIYRIKTGYWKTGTKGERLKIILLMLWATVAALVIWACFFSWSGYIYPRAFENV